MKYRIIKIYDDFIFHYRSEYWHDFYKVWMTLDLHVTKFGAKLAIKRDARKRKNAKREDVIEILEL